MSTDITGREGREPGKSGERYREAHERRARESQARRDRHWAERMEKAQTPLQAFRVAVDRLSTAVVQEDRRALVAYDRASRDQPGGRKEQAAKTHLDRTREGIESDLVWLSEQALEIAARHEITRV